jgi:hypothetical protein
MSRTINCDTTEKISIEECFAGAIDAIDPACVDSIVAFSPQIKKLSNNRTAISQALCEYLKDYSSVEYGGVNYSPNSFILSPAHPNFVIRANIWLPLCADAERRVFEANLFAYHRAHNHNFHFLTVGHHGPGYATDIYAYERASIAGYLNEPVEMTHLEHTSLTPGKVMFYEAGKDIHSQYPSASASVSLNLVVVSEEDRLHDQYFFDTKKSTICGYSDTLATKRVSLLRFAACVADANTIDVLSSIAVTHPCHRTRLQAFISLAIARPDELAYWRCLASRDGNVAVRDFGNNELSVSNEQMTFDPAFMQLV